MRCRAHLLNEQEDTTGGTTTSDSLPASTVVLSALAPKDRAFDEAMPLPPVERHFRRALAEQKSSMSSCFARRKGWRCSTNDSLPPGGAAAPKRTNVMHRQAEGVKQGCKRAVHPVAYTASGGLSHLQFPWRSHLNSNLKGSQSFCCFIFFKPTA